MGNSQFKYQPLINEDEHLQDCMKSLPAKDKMNEKAKYIYYFLCFLN